ncbi:MAG TPA: hypothetical protein VLF18_10285, partial [Tahibacter sp.]|uniref:hypothetical protein n=1 Tax=Tahibacter sp. TaxID=2056211 RepID=UPI002B52B517
RDAFYEDTPIAAPAAHCPDAASVAPRLAAAATSPEKAEAAESRASRSAVARRVTRACHNCPCAVQNFFPQFRKKSFAAMSVLATGRRFWETSPIASR